MKFLGFLFLLALLAAEGWSQEGEGEGEDNPDLQGETPEEGTGSKTPETAKKEQTSKNSFLKLNVSEKYFHGARWEFQYSPRRNRRPRIVFHVVEIIDVSTISDANAEFRLDINLRQRWGESELIVPEELFQASDSADENNVPVDPHVLNEIWTPDAYMPNARDMVIEKLVDPHQSVRIFKNKTIIYYNTFHATLGCPMDFHWYPCDIQFCELILESFVHPNDKVIFEFENSSEPVILPKNFRLRRYALQTPLPRRKGNMTRFGRGEQYSRITIEFVFQREIGHHLIQVYFPTFLIVAVSWYSFWLGLDAIPGRVSLLVTCMLTLVTMYSNSKADLPPVAYIKMLDIWMAACLGFVFAALSEFIIVKYIQHTTKAAEAAAAKKSDGQQPLPLPVQNSPINTLNKKKVKGILRSQYPEFYQTSPDIMNQFHRRQAWEIPNGPLFGRDVPLGSDDEFYEAWVQEKKRRRQLKQKQNGQDTPRWEVIDKISRAGFPLAFLCFCCGYWPYLWIGSMVWQQKNIPTG